MNDQMNTPVSPAPTPSGNEQIMAIVSLVVGVISLCGIVVPIIGIPLGILGIVLGYFARKSAAWKTYATIGMALSGGGILLSCVPVGVIATMRLLGPKIGTTFSTISNSLP
ncbi:MAG TPA: hypothetical protein VLE49_20710 [Anaerolineales bacterium]|nr:hypothetical protein [Anaerolineales bacterium]